MTLGFAFKVFLEIGIVLLITYGIFHEDKLIEFESELVPLIKFMFNKYILKKNVSAKKTDNNHRVGNVHSGVTKHRAEIKKLPSGYENHSFKRVA